MRVAVFLFVLLAGCAANRDGQQASPVRDILPNARNISPDVDADHAQIGGTRAAAGAQVVEVHTNGLTTVLAALGGTVLLGLVFGVLLYRSNPPTKGNHGLTSPIRPVGRPGPVVAPE